MEFMLIIGRQQDHVSLSNYPMDIITAKLIRQWANSLIVMVTVIKTTSPHKYFKQWFSNDSIIIKKLNAKPIKKLRNQDQKKRQKKTKFQPMIIFYFRIDDGDEVTPNFFGKKPMDVYVFFFLFFCQWHQIRTKNFQFLLFFFSTLSQFSVTQILFDSVSIGACKPKI